MAFCLTTDVWLGMLLTSQSFNTLPHQDIGVLLMLEMLNEMTSWDVRWLLQTVPRRCNVGSSQCSCLSGNVSWLQTVRVGVCFAIFCHLPQPLIDKCWSIAAWIPVRPMVCQGPFSLMPNTTLCAAAISSFDSLLALSDDNVSAATCAPATFSITGHLASRPSVMSHSLVCSLTMAFREIPFCPPMVTHSSFSSQAAVKPRSASPPQLQPSPSSFWLGAPEINPMSLSINVSGQSTSVLNQYWSLSHIEYWSLSHFPRFSSKIHLWPLNQYSMGYRNPLKGADILAAVDNSDNGYNQTQARPW